MFSRMVKRKSRNPPEPEMEADVRRFPFWLRRKKAPRNQYEGDADDEDENNEDEEDEIDQVKAQREWEAYREKNISIVVDLFEGQLRSTLTCCNCARRSSRFEPFRFLSVPVPIQPDRPFDITLVSLRAGEPMLVKYSVLVAKDCLVEAALDALSDQLPVPAASLVLAEVYLHRISRYIPPHIELSEIRSEDAIYAYVVSQSIEEIRGVQHRDSARGSWPSEQEEQRRLSVASVETNEAGERESWASEKEELISLEIIHRRLAELNRTPEKTVTKREIFGLPLLSAVGSWFTFEQLNEHLQQIAALYAGASGVPLPHVRVVSANGQETGQVLPESGPMRLRGPRVHLAFDWDMPFDVQVMEHPSVEAVQHQLAAIGREKLLELSDCLDAFVAPEFLGDGNKVYCSKCKSQQRVRKQIDIWREPDILIVHIKRFQFNGTCFEKLGQHIEPPEEFDLGKWIAKRDEYVVEGAIYTLYGIATHHGGLSGGHYFSTCANSAGDETTWYKFNDTVVTKYTPEEFKAASSHRQGYVLFYRKQNLSASNLINYALVAPRPDVQTPPEQSGRLWSA
jgi:ubiquitin carboxyl-terminal hydrolase 4/11/15